MRVAFLVDPGDPHGLAAVAERMGAHGVEATLIASGGPGADAPLAAGVETAPLAAPTPFDLAVATGARTAARFDAIPASGRALLLMDMEDRALIAGSADSEAAAAAFTLPVPKVVPARWMADQLEQLGPAPVHVVAPGIDHQHFAPSADLAGAAAAPLRVLVLGAPRAPSSGLDEALAAAAAMREPATVARLDPDAAPPAERAAAYAGADVVLALPRIAGFPRAPLEAFHRGATCVMTAVTGHDEYVVDGVNGLLTSWDDERGTSRLLDLVARDRALLQRLRTAALDTARAWPDADEGARRLAVALEACV